MPGAARGDHATRETCKVYLDQLRATIEIVHETGPPEEIPVDPERIDSLVDLFRVNHQRDK